VWWSPEQIAPKRGSVWYVLGAGNAKKEILVQSIPRQLTLLESGLLGPIGVYSVTAK